MSAGLSDLMYGLGGLLLFIVIVLVIIEIILG